VVSVLLHSLFVNPHAENAVCVLYERVCACGHRQIPRLHRSVPWPHERWIRKTCSYVKRVSRDAQRRSDGVFVMQRPSIHVKDPGPHTS
jgi:hypothetical protein